MEFTQFHPTSLYLPGGGMQAGRSFLISEAVRGEGGVLRLPDGTRFMARHDPRCELAPRDVVARAIDLEMKARAIDCVYLDISHRPAAFLHTHFPTILARCQQAGLDMTRQPIPVVPAAHYTCGGVLTDLAGRTDVAGLYAVGEVACTGLHGANRLASNSLLECVVLGRSCAGAILGRTPAPASCAYPSHPARAVAGGADGRVAWRQYQDALRRLMWDEVGIVRSSAGLARARARITALRVELSKLAGAGTEKRQWLELRNMIDVADIMVRCAQARGESRGLHMNRDRPGMLPEAHATVLDGARGHRRAAFGQSRSGIAGAAA